MGGFDTMGKTLVVIGVALAALGGLVWLLSKAPFLGNLPGDIRIERPGMTCLIPLASSILISIVLTIVLNIVVRIINR